MRKILSLALAGITAVSVLVSCSNPSAESSFTASEEMTKYETLIKDRFGITSDSLVIATGDEGAKYGVDTDKFIDDEGYTIRASDGDVVIIGKTGAGIDRAVRQFTNYGNLEDYTFTYGEGYRVKKLTVNGNDILDYAVVYPNDADECMLFATDELVKYIELTCGTVLPKYSADMYASAESKPAHTIALSMDYPTLGDEAFTINVKDDGNIDILCGRYRGGLYGVYDLLKDMGWRFLSDGTEYLYEAEVIDLTSDINRTEEPAIANRFAAAYPISYDFYVGNKLNFHGRYINPEVTSKYGYYGIIREACHGLVEFSGNIDWNGSYSGFNGSQPCFTDEGVLQAIENHYRNYLTNKTAAGAVPGRDIPYIDVSQFDSDPSGFCTCSNCMAYGSASATVLNMTNRIADMVANEFSPDIDVLMLAYCGTNKPPRNKSIVPRDNVKIAYCFYYTSEVTVCSNHNITGEDCSDGKISNKVLNKEFEGWKEICPEGGLQVWYYPMNSYELAFQVPGYDTAYGDMKYFIDSGVSCIMFCEGENNDPILLTALGDLVWDADMTEEEYKKLLEEYFCIYYGKESGKYIYEYSEIITKAGDLKGCFCSYGCRMFDKVDTEYIAAQFDYMTGLFDLALKYAESEKEQNRIEILKARMMYLGISVVHEDRYVNGTEEQRAVIAERYTEMHDLFRKHNIPVYDNIDGRHSAPETIDITKSPSVDWFDRYVTVA